MKNIIWLFVIVVFGLAGCASAPIASETGLTFIHLNDTYRVGAVEDGTAGGLSRVVTLVRELQADGRDVRLLHGGDFLYPSLESQLWNGLQMVDAMNFLNAVAPLYVTAGNHEFDRRGPEQLIAALRESMFTWLGDNYALDTGEPAADQKLQKGFTFTAGDRRVGVFSLTLHGADGGNTRSYVDIDNDYMGVAERAIQALEAQGVDLIIGVTHVHMWQDVEIALLKKRYPKLAFIVGGHEHEPQYFYIEGESAPAMKGASNARVIWQIDVDFDDTGGYTVTEQRTKLDESIPFDPEYEVLADKWNNRLLEKFPFLEARVGAAALAMDAREEHVRSKESSWGNFVVDQMRTAFGDPPADLAFINSGTLRIDDFIAGDIHFEDIGRTFGFSSYLRYTTVTGAEFREIMEAGYRGEPVSQGYFPQISGFRVCVDRSRNEHDRIVSLQVPTESGWAEIDPAREYTLIIPDFLYRGGDGYEIPKDRFASRPGSELKYLVLDAILRAQGAGEAVGEPVTRENRRYHLLREPKERCFTN
jgi:5'-nucleotidase